MRKENIDIWGRHFELDVEFRIYHDQSVLPLQELSIASLIASPLALETSQKAIEEYIINDYRNNFPEVDNIFKYVMPKYFFVPRDSKKRVVALMCNYKFDREHGIAVVFEDEQLKEIGSQDIIL